MALRAGDLIDAARDYHMSFNSFDTPTPMLLRQLSRMERRLYQAIAEIHPDILTTVIDYDNSDLVAAMVDSEGLLLPDHLFILGVTARANDVLADVMIIPAADRNGQKGNFPTVYQLGNTLHLTDQRDWDDNSLHGWEDYETMYVYYVPLPTPLEDNDSSLLITDHAQDVLVAGLALFMATRMKVLKDLPSLPVEYKEAEATLIANMANRDNVVNWTVKVIE